MGKHPGLVVTAEDSRYKGLGFKSRHRLTYVDTSVLK